MCATSASVFAASVWKFKNADTASGLMYFDYGIAVVLVLLGGWLYLLNQRHGFMKLIQAGVSREMAITIGQVYTLVSVTLILSLAMPRWAL